MLKMCQWTLWKYGQKFIYESNNEYAGPNFVHENICVDLDLKLYA